MSLPRPIVRPRLGSESSDRCGQSDGEDHRVPYSQRHIFSFGASQKPPGFDCRVQTKPIVHLPVFPPSFLVYCTNLLLCLNPSSLRSISLLETCCTFLHWTCSLKQEVSKMLKNRNCVLGNMGPYECNAREEKMGSKEILHLSESESADPKERSDARSNMPLAIGQ